ncbi:MAG: tetratricopeptide repeat protein [Myxococcales bacterium]|nr:tetratricopeptide repeat protein [Myxococcales bacterium]
MRASALIVVAALVTAPAAARADELIEAGHPVEVAGGYVLDVDGDGLRVRQGARRAPLTIAGGRPASHATVEVARHGAAVTLRFMPTCWDVSETFSPDQLEARLAHATGVALRRRDPDGALAELTRAHALDPGFAPAAADLARALIAAGRLDEAAAALPIADPVARLVAATIDPTLAPLRDHPSMSAARAATPGGAALGPTGIGVTAAGDLVVREALGSHGACWSVDALRVLDGQTLRERARIPLVGQADFDGDGCDARRPHTAAGRRRIRARQALADQVLTALGTVPAAGELATGETDWTRHVRKLRFAAADLGLVIGADGAARWFRHGVLLAEHGPGTAPAAGDGLITEPRAVLLPDQRRAILEVNTTSCEWNEESLVVAIPAP